MRGALALLAVAAAAAAGLGALAVAAPARAATCPDESISTKLEAADVAFVGRLVSRRAVATSAGIPQYDYRFVVYQDVKGDLAPHVTVRAAKLVDLDAQELTPASKVDVGVLATSASGRLVTSTCGLVDAGSLLGAADEPKGGGIKVGVGLVILALVLAYSFRRLKRQAPRQPGRGSPRRGA